MIFFVWLVGVVGLLFYSFTQIDLNLTLSRASLIQTGEKAFQYIGYFNRPLSTELFIAILVILFGAYVYLLYQANKNKLSHTKVWQVILITSGLLLFSYNAFSYDLFNYIFGAKTIVHYHANPYQFAPWTYTGDPMLTFMHNVDKVYVYGPLALVMTVPLVFLGFGFFIPTFFLLKALGVATFLGSAYLIEKILTKFLPSQTQFGLVFFAFNPLVIIESLVSGHNDIWMMFFALAAVWLLFTKKYLLALSSLALSFLTKQVTVFLIPLFAIYILPFVRKFMNYTTVIVIALISQGIGGWYVLQQREIQPWYFLWLLPLMTLLPKNSIITCVTIGFSLGLLLRYVSYLYFGNWDQMSGLRGEFTLITPIVFGVIGVIIFLTQKFLLKNNG